MIDKVWLGLGLVATGLVASGPVHAQQLALTAAEASFVGETSDGCVESNFEVFVRDNRRAARIANAVSIEVVASVFDHCEGEALLETREKAKLRRDMLSVGGPAVTLDTAIPAVNAISKNAIKVEIALAWHADGEPAVATTRRGAPDSRRPGPRLDRAVTRALSPAVASGRVAIDGETLIDGSTDDATIWFGP